MTDPKETTSDTAVEQHGAGVPNPDERDPDKASDVGGPAGGIETTLGDAMDEPGSLGGEDDEGQARNPI